MDTREEEYRRIYAEQYPKVVRYLHRIVGEADAEDVAQETFVKVHRALDGFRGESSLATWIYRIATNAARDRLRSPSSRLSAASVELQDEDATADETVRAAEDRMPRLDSLLIRRDMNDCIRGIVDGLPGNYRTVLVLSDLEGFSNSEICAVLDLPLDTVKIRLHRARKRLKAALEANCHLYLDDRNELACDRKFPPLKFMKK